MDISLERDIKIAHQDTTLVLYYRKPKSPRRPNIPRYKSGNINNFSVCRGCGCEIDRHHEWCKKCYKEEIQ